MTTPNAPPTAAELATWLQADAVMLREAMARIGNRWQYIERLGEDVLGPDNYRLFAIMAQLSAMYYGGPALPEANYNSELSVARRGA